MKATKVYRDNFVYKINSPLCDNHASQCSHSSYSYFDTEFKPEEIGAECEHCVQEIRKQKLDANLIHWFLISEGKPIFDCKDRVTFWAYVKQYRKTNRYNYDINEILL